MTTGMHKNVKNPSVQEKIINSYLISHTESKESRAPYKEKVWETRLPRDSSGSTKKKVNLRYLP